MLDDVYKPEDRTTFLEGYQYFDEWVKNLEGTMFSKMNNEQQNTLLNRLNDKEEGIDQKLQAFYDIVKNESIRYLRTSEYYQRKVNYYEMAPGRFKGDVLLSELKNANQI